MAHAENITVLNQHGRSGVGFAPPVRAVRLRKRHIVLALSFVLMVLLPIVGAAGYLWLRAADQYSSVAAFSVRSEESAPGVELLGGIADLSGSGAQDSDILYDFLGSQQLVEQVQKRIDLEAIWSIPRNDPVFAYARGGRIEDLHAYWKRMVRISHDATRGIVEVEARGFAPEDATRLNELILLESSELINTINNIAHDDAVRYTLDDLQRAKNRLSEARSALTEFRILNEIVDPSIEASSQTSLIASLDAQLTETLIEIDMLRANTRGSDTRLTQAEQRAEVLRRRIAEERGMQASGGKNGLAEIYGEYERLRVEVEFAEQSYQIARAGFDGAVSEARRNTRYLAAHINPTLAQQSLLPQRGMMLAGVGFGAFLLWALFALISFSFLDRR